MLSRTADHLFWMSRYTERAENTARMLDVNYQTSLLPQSADAAELGWRGLLSISELTGHFLARYGAIDARGVMDYMVRNEDNPSSIWNCLRAARENARAVRGALTTEVWETENQTWLEFNRLLKDGALERDPGAFFEWVKFRSHLSRGVTVGTMLIDDALHFIRLGTFLERADNTARLLDVKYHALTGPEGARSAVMAGSVNPVTSVTAALASAPGLASTLATSESLLPSPAPAPAPTAGPRRTPPVPTHAQPQEVDFYHWSAILRSVSGFEIYRKVYRNVIRPERVAELLILRPDMPRSLAACMNEVVANLQGLANAQSGETLRRAGRLQSDLRYARIDEILDTGLHAFLTQFLDRVNDLGTGISRDFLVPMAA